MPLKRFSADMFMPTKWSTALDKAAFANHLLTFILSNFPERQFTHKFYNELMQHFGFIAHYDKAGFWAEYFTTSADSLRFIQELAGWACWGSPEHTFCDVESAIRSEVRGYGLIGQFRVRVEQEKEAAERALLEQLQAKYGTPVWEPSSSIKIPTSPTYTSLDVTSIVQCSLFA